MKLKETRLKFDTSPSWQRRPLPRLILSLVSLASFTACPSNIFDPLPQDTGIIGVSLGKVAVITGDNERVEELLTEFEVPFELFDGFRVGPPEDALLWDEYQDLPSASSLLLDAEALSRYGVLFLNCGTRGMGEPDLQTLEPDTSRLSAEQVAIIRDFVEDGGELYLSDRSYPLLEALYPGALDFYGDDDSLEAALVGAKGALQATLVNAEFREDVGASTVWLEYPLQGWAAIEKTSDEVAPQVLLAGDAPLQLAEGTSLLTSSPLLIRFEAGIGAITFSTFHNQPEVDQTFTDLQIHLLRRLGGAR